MAYLAPIARLALPATFIALALAACGGQSFNGGGGEGASGAEPPGGSSGQGGSSSTGGKGSAGSSSKAGSGSAGSSVGGSAWGPECSGPPEAGNCNAYFPAWYHDAKAGICRPFAYGGCGGNENRYESLAACQAACSGGQPNYDSCKVNSDCVVAGGGCCGLCDSPGLTAHDVIAYNRAYGAEIQQCDGRDIACAPCALPEPGQGALQYLVPLCEAQQCVVEDIRASSVTACKADTDCRLRNGTSCCQSCSSENPVAVRVDGSFEKLVCGDEPAICPDCAALPSEIHVAVCGASGHCEVALKSLK
jgi:hypothetical protein